MDRYSKFILTVIALGLWFLVAVLVLQPTTVKAYGTQDVRVVGWDVYTPVSVDLGNDCVQVDLEKIDGNAASMVTGWGMFTPPIPVEIKK